MFNWSTKGRKLDQTKKILGMGSLILIAFLAFGAADLVAAEKPIIGPQPRILSFTQWKEEQVTQATNRRVRAQNELLLAQKREAQPKILGGLEKEQAMSNHALEITKEFTIEDYFVVYLAKLGDSGFVLREAAKVLSDDEVAALMKAFIHSQNKGSNPSGSAWVPSLNSGASKKL